MRCAGGWKVGFHCAGLDNVLGPGAARNFSLLKRVMILSLFISSTPRRWLGLLRSIKRGKGTGKGERGVAVYMYRERAKAVKNRHMGPAGRIEFDRA